MRFNELICVAFSLSLSCFFALSLSFFSYLYLSAVKVLSHYIDFFLHCSFHFFFSHNNCYTVHSLQLCVTAHEYKNHDNAVSHFTLSILLMRYGEYISELNIESLSYLMLHSLLESLPEIASLITTKTFNCCCCTVYHSQKSLLSRFLLLSRFTISSLVIILAVILEALLTGACRCSLMCPNAWNTQHIDTNCSILFNVAKFDDALEEGKTTHTQTINWKH